MEEVMEFIRKHDLTDEFGEWMKKYEINDRDDFEDVLRKEGKNELLEKFGGDYETYGSAYNKTKPQIDRDILEKVRRDYEVREKKADSELLRFVDPIPDPINLDQALALSKKLTAETNIPCYVFSNCKEAHTRGLVSGEYTKTTVKVTLALGEGEEVKGRYQLWRAYEAKKADQPNIRFITEEKPSRWTKKPDKCMTFERYLYLAQAENRQIVLLSNTPLDVGREYEVTGYCFDAVKFDELNVNLGSLQSTFLSFNEKSAYETDSVDEDILDRCQKGGRSYVIDSLMYPWHYSIQDYKELWATNFFSVNTGFPYNLMVIGESGLTKTSVLDKIQAITGESQASGSGTLKGLIASFSSSNLSAGHLAEARDKALVNEFFEILNNTSKDERYNYLSPMKELLEGKKTEVPSGNGTISTVMKADLCAVSNPPRKQGGNEFESIIDMYDSFETAWMDRMLFYWIPQEEQEKFKNQKEDWADQKMEEAQEDYEKLDFEDHDSEFDQRYLNLEELYGLLRYARSVDWTVVDNTALKQAKNELKNNYIPNTVRASRLRKFLLNIASGEALIRYLANGETPENNLLDIEKEDIQRAKNLLINVYKTYTGDSISSRGTKVAELPNPEFKIYSKIENYYHNQESKYAKKLTIPELKEAVNIDGDVEEKVENLVEKGLAVRSGDELMWMPSMDSELKSALRLIKKGDEVPKEQNWKFKRLSELGLVSYNEDRGQYYLWDQETEVSPDDILELLEDREMMTVSKIADELGAKDDTVAELLEDLADKGDVFEPEPGSWKLL